MRKKLKGFTLVELLAAMAIIAVLIGLAGFGISIALRNSRDTQRKAKLNDIQLAINEYYTSASAYPASITGGGSATAIQVTGGSAVPVKGATKAAASTSTSGTKYHYKVVTGGYLLCAELESNNAMFDLSTGTGTCDTTTDAITANT
jgi:prepilin-type N-terminal cleavage/methylation domain-containing protein